jgi:hypothetical protein
MKADMAGGCPMDSVASRSKRHCCLGPESLISDLLLLSSSRSRTPLVSLVVIAMVRVCAAEARFALSIPVTPRGGTSGGLGFPAGAGGSGASRILARISSQVG